MIIALVGEHAAAAWKFVKHVPDFARRSMLGWRISPPKQPGSEKLRSSTRIMRKFGFFVFISLETPLEGGKSSGEGMGMEWNVKSSNMQKYKMLLSLIGRMNQNRS